MNFNDEAGVSPQRFYIQNLKTNIYILQVVSSSLILVKKVLIEFYGFTIF